MLLVFLALIKIVLKRGSLQIEQGRDFASTKCVMAMLKSWVAKTEFFPFFYKILINHRFGFLSYNTVHPASAGIWGNCGVDEV